MISWWFRLLGKCKRIIVCGDCIGSASLPWVITELAHVRRATLIFLLIPTCPLTWTDGYHLLAYSSTPDRACVAYGFRDVDIIWFCDLDVSTRIFRQPGTCQTIFIINNHEASVVLFFHSLHKPLGLWRALRALVWWDRLLNGALHVPLGIPDTRLLNDHAWLLFLWRQHYWESGFLVEFLGYTFRGERMHRLYGGSMLLRHAFGTPKGTLILATYYYFAWLWVGAHSSALHLVLHFDQLL